MRASNKKDVAGRGLEGICQAELILRWRGRSHRWLRCTHPALEASSSVKPCHCHSESRFSSGECDTVASSFTVTGTGNKPHAGFFSLSKALMKSWLAHTNLGE